MIRRYDEDYDSIYNELFFDLDSTDSLLPFQRKESAIKRTIRDIEKFLEKDIYHRDDIDMVKWMDWQGIAETSHILIEVDVRNHFESSSCEELVGQALPLIESAQETYDYNESELDWETTACNMVGYLVELKDLLYDLEEASL